MPDPMTTFAPYVVRRSIVVSGLNPGQGASDVVADLSAQQGIVKVTADPRHKRLRISYDVKQLLFDDIARLLSSLGMTISTHWWMRFKAGWYRLLDENARANANSKGGACCSNPTEIYARRSRRG